MNTRNKISILVLVLSIGCFFASCNLEQDVAPYLTYDGEANCTIADLLTYHEAGSSDSFDSIPRGIVISGIVTSSDKEGNCYKYLTIEDGTGGIQIKINNTSLYHKYALGQRIFVQCDGLVLGDYRKLHQLGWWANDGMEAIPSSFESTYLFRDSLVGPNPQPTVTFTSANQISQNPMYYNMLVKIDSCYFPDAGIATFSEVGTSTSHDIVLKGGGTIILRTSNYASFAQEMLPKGTGSIIGILTRYNNDSQLIIRSLDDLIGFKQEAEEVTLFSDNFSSNPFENGWTKTTISGAEWEYINNDVFMGVTITGENGANNSWLISPTLNIQGGNNTKLSFDHRAFPDGSGSNEVMKVYYSTQPGNTFNANDFIELPVNSFTTNLTTTTISLPNDAVSPNLRIAFRYLDDTNTHWYVTNVTVKSTITPR